MRDKVKDSALAFFVSELDNLDKRLYEPLMSVTWSRDITLRTDVTFAEESTSFIRATFSGGGTLSSGTNATPSNGPSKPWLAVEQDALPAVGVGGNRVVTPLRPLGRQVSYSSIELQRGQLLGRPIDAQKIDAMNSLYALDTDAMVYIGDADVGALGLVNSDQVTAGSVSGGVWTGKTPAQILTDVNNLIESAWAASGFAVCPSKLLLPPAQYAYIATQLISTAGTVSILKYLEDNSISLRVNGKALDIQPLKWLTGRGATSTDRMVCYSNQNNYVRFPMVPIRRETPYYHSINFFAPYIYGFGSVEFIYPETVQYADGI